MWTSINQLFARVVDFWAPDPDLEYEDALVSAYIEHGTPHKDETLLEQIRYHEAGHAIVGSYIKGRKLLLISVLEYDTFRGKAGFTEGSIKFQAMDSEQQLLDIAYCVAGEEAEKIKYGSNHVSGGFGHADTSEKKNETNTDNTKSDKEGAEDYSQKYFEQWQCVLDPGIDAAAIIREARLLAHKILLNEWDAVERIVAESKSQAVLSGTHVRKIIDDNRRAIDLRNSEQPSP